MRSTAPTILVVARARDDAEMESLRASLFAQTYPAAELLIVPRPNDDLDHPATDICPEGEFSRRVEASNADMVLFWPDDGNLPPAAIEKLVLALQLCPDQAGVADAAKGETGLWLVRRTAATTGLINFWIKSQLKWIEECLAKKPALFFMAEKLSDASEPTALRRPYAVEKFFTKLPSDLASFQPIAVDPPWKIESSEPDSTSVLFLVNSLPMGGACKFILDIAGQLKSRGHRVTVATTTYDTRNPNPWLGELLKITPEVFVLSHTRPLDLPRLIVHLARARRCGRVVISHSMLGYQLLPWLRSQLPGVAFLDYTHIEYETEWPEGGYALRSVQNQSLLDVAMVSSAHLREWMTDRGADSARIRVCHTNIDANKWIPSADDRARVRFELNLDRKTALILYPCRLAEQKRPELLCNIVLALRQATKAPFVVVIAGDGPLMAPLKKFVASRGLDDCVRLLGAVPLQRVAQLHNAADIFLLPSLIDGIALALFEAMALESVPVISDVGGQRELLTPECGHLIPVGDPAKEIPQYVAHLKDLLERPEKRRAMGAAARARVREHFRLDQMTDTFIAAMDEAATRAAARAVPLPDPRLCREIATLALEQVRLALDNSIKLEAIFLLEEKMDKQDKVIQRLQRHIATLRSSQLAREENEPAY
jgi:glycosyltransferase involved in cell wall biosynthesis